MNNKMSFLLHPVLCNFNAKPNDAYLYCFSCKDCKGYISTVRMKDSTEVGKEDGERLSSSITREHSVNSSSNMNDEVKISKKRQFVIKSESKCTACIHISQLDFLLNEIP